MANPIISAGDELERRREFESRISERLKQGKAGLLRRILSLGMRERLELNREVHLRASIREVKKRQDGELQRLGFSFVRHGIFVARGVGKGRPANSAKAKAAAKDWLTPELDLLLDDIADIAADGYADLIAVQFKINIPGLFFRVTG
jgi:hypothetical protein